MQDDTVTLTPARRLTLEDAVEYVIDGEFVEVTPTVVRMGVYPDAKKSNSRR